MLQMPEGKLRARPEKRKIMRGHFKPKAAQMELPRVPRKS